MAGYGMNVKSPCKVPINNITKLMDGSYEDGLNGQLELPGSPCLKNIRHSDKSEDI